MHTPNLLSELSARLTERDIIATDVMPFCLINPNHAGHALRDMLRGLVEDDIAEAFQITTMDFYTERAAAPTFEDAVAALMARHSGTGTGWLVRYFLPTPRGGYSTKLAYAPTITEAMHRMLQA